jgi:uncharacterized membrane protein
MSRMDTALLSLTLVGIVALMAAANALGIVFSLIGVLILIVLPGAGLARLLGPSRMSIGGQVAVSVGLGLALAVVVGVALDLSPIGIQHAPTVMTGAAILSAVSLAPAAARGLRRLEVPSADWAGQAALLALAVALATGAYAGARVVAERQGPSELTQLWILPSGGEGVRVGVANVGTSSVQWRLVVREGAEVLAEDTLIALRPGESWEMTVTLTQPAEPVTASLFLPDDVTAMHQVSLAAGAD